ncbi:hypothetical protein [Paenibacillus ginsengihumi]|jgi:hypothetical protein|uniref:hypothetical protein n=1 Tax=Paenibacillus ginsengihumi TaxID=431596 RepID=UPI000375C480|nr:hypothetical protein [Paenibacillus ginsengihumi]
MAEAILAFRVSTYARNIYMTGTERLTAREHYGGIPENYRIPVLQFAAKNYYIDWLDHALDKGWITPQEYQETIAMKTAEDPQYRNTAS